MNTTGRGGINLRGGIDVENMDKYPDAIYWRGGAESAKKKVFDVCPPTWTSHIEKVLARIWNDGFTWMDICLQTEIALGFLRTHFVEQEDTVQS